VISVIVCSIDPVKFANVSANFARCFPNDTHEIIGVHDAASLCEGYNRGLAKARGKVCIFSHDDIEILTDDVGETLYRQLQTADVIGVAGTNRLHGMGWANSGINFAYGAVAAGVPGDYEVTLFGAEAELQTGMMALDGVFIATRRELATAVGFDERTFDGWHGYDTDFTLRSYLAGYRIAVSLEIVLTHASSANVDRAWLRYDQRFRQKHGAHLAPDAGPWYNVRKRVRTRAEIKAAFHLPTLRALTEDVRCRAALVPIRTAV